MDGLMQNILWFLLPIAALSGWWAASLSFDKKRKNKNLPLSTDYYRGLSYLLNEQPDKAIEIFINLVEVDSETIETHLALGSLYRRRGEVERAIRIHQNIIARPSLEQDEKALALLELGKDYMHAGLLDRAERLFRELLLQSPNLVEALKDLLDIYQQENEWTKAINVANKLKKIGEPSMDAIIAQYYCEIAVNHIKLDNMNKASIEIDNALRSDAKCVRASILLGDIEYKNRNYNQAAKYYTFIFEQDPKFIPEVVGKILDTIHHGASSKYFINYIKRVAIKTNSNLRIPGISSYICETQGQTEAIQYLSHWLREYPTVEILKEWMELEQLNILGGTSDNKNIKFLLEVLESVLEDKPAYQCQICGLSGKQLYWQCPGCQAWSSTKPIVNIEAD